jgi:hypothetical protein
MIRFIKVARSSLGASKDINKDKTGRGTVTT